MHNFMSMGEECSLTEDEESSLIEQPSKKPKNGQPEHDPVEYKVTDGYWENGKLTEVKLENAVDFSLAIRMCTRKAVLQALTRLEMNESTSCTMSSTKRIVILNMSMILVLRGIMS